MQRISICSWFSARVIALAVIFCALKSFALGPHEIILLINDESIDSVLLGQVYQRVRAIPDRNVIRVSIPTDVYDEKTTAISPENFTKYIWEPMQDGIQDAGIGSQVLACVFSCGFPTRVTVPQQISLTGAVFLRNVIPTEAQLQHGTYVSELFASPARPDAPMDGSTTFEAYRNRLLEAMPFPAMMLAYTGKNGITLDEAIKTVERSAKADCTHPKGTFYFQVNDDVRTKCRLWEYEPIAAQLNAFEGISTVISTNAPTQADFPLCGFMTGVRNYKTQSLEFHLGVYADHLTSFGGTYERVEHTKATAWTKAGAGFSSGTVTEPYAIWTKFAHAAIFLHQLRGCTAIESFYQAVRSPLHILPIGDPLANPWGERIEPSILDADGSLSGRVDLRASVVGEQPNQGYRFHWFLDGKRISMARTCSINTSALTNGEHLVRVVATRRTGSVWHQGYFEKVVVIEND